MPNESFKYLFTFIVIEVFQLDLFIGYSPIYMSNL
jgi:hypothetical protein